MNSRITNDDAIGNYFVQVFADNKMVNSFQTRGFIDIAREEASRISNERSERGLKTRYAQARKIIAYVKDSRGRRKRIYGENIILFDNTGRV